MIIDTKLGNGCHIPEIPETLASTAYHCNSPAERTLIRWDVPMKIRWVEKVLPQKMRRPS